MQLRRLWHQLALALLLAFAQQQAVLHELQHGIDAVQGKSNPASPLHEVCLKCLFFAGIGSAPASHVPAFEAPEAQHSLIATVQRPQRSVLSFSAYRSRAPPLNS